ncbi:MAG: DUF5615 family PIN-like protein [Tepidisphaeraceae bacterium]
MKLLADENMDRAIVEWLREVGHDVAWVAENLPGTSDARVLELAIAESRVLATNDLDFGEHVYRIRRPAPGVLLLRFNAATEEQRLAHLKKHWPTIEARVTGHFVVATNRRVRVRPL